MKQRGDKGRFIRIDGREKLEKGMAETTRKMPQSIYDAVRDACLAVETRAKTHHLAGATLTPRTHRLQQSVKTSPPRLSGGKITGRVGSPVVYAAIHEYGGIIKPKKARFLTFQVNGRWVRATQVRMPKREWLSKSLHDVQGQIERIFGRKIEIAIG